jgi:hypothetical protein
MRIIAINSGNDTPIKKPPKIKPPTRRVLLIKIFSDRPKAQAIDNVTVRINSPVIRQAGNRAITPIIPPAKLTAHKINEITVVTRAFCCELISLIFGFGSRILSISPLEVSYFYF